MYKQSLADEVGKKTIIKALKIIFQRKKYFKLFPERYLLDISGIKYKDKHAGALNRIAAQLAFKSEIFAELNWRNIINKIEYSVEYLVAMKASTLPALREKLKEYSAEDRDKMKDNFLKDTDQQFKEAQVNFINEQLGVKLKVPQIDWNKAELFQASWTLFHRDMIFDTRELKVNDWYDLHHLLYVTPGVKYLTYEKKKGRGETLIKNCGMEKYLIEKPPMRIL